MAIKGAALSACSHCPRCKGKFMREKRDDVSRMSYLEHSPGRSDHSHLKGLLTVCRDGPNWPQHRMYPRAVGVAEVVLTNSLDENYIFFF